MASAEPHPGAERSGDLQDEVLAMPEGSGAPERPDANCGVDEKADSVPEGRGNPEGERTGDGTSRAASSRGAASGTPWAHPWFFLRDFPPLSPFH